MADLSTLQGISDARNDLYNKLESGALDERRALSMERVLRGQQSIKADVPIRLFGLLVKTKGTSAERYAPHLMRSLLKFTTGEDMPAELPTGG